MKIYTKVVFDLQGHVLDEHSYEYHGPVAWCKGGDQSGGRQETVTKVEVPEKTAAEKELDQFNMDTAQQQRQNFLVMNAQQNPSEALAYLRSPTSTGRFAGLEKYADDAFRQSLMASESDAQRTKQFNDTIYQQLSDRLSGKAFLTPQEQDALDKLYASSKATGEEDLTKYGQQIAAQRGMRTSDSPIGNEMVRERGRLALGLESAKASSMLQLSQGQKNFEESVRQFQEGLANQGFQNKLALSSANPLSFNLASQLAGQRFQTPTQTSNTQKSLGIGDWLSGVGGLGFGWKNG